jgi:RNA polymerase sigma-70 factor (ECF subfamily)
MDDPDFKLIDATGRGDKDAFESLVRRYQGPLLNFITRYVGDRSLAEDITQEVFLRVFRAAHRFEAKTKVSTWIFHIAYNQAMTELRRRKRHRNLFEAMNRSRDEVKEEAQTEPSECFELEEEILAAMGRLPENQRAALLLRVNEDLSYREIAEVLAVSVQSVESLLFRARTSLRRYLKEK